MSEPFSAHVENMAGFTAAMQQAPKTLDEEMLTASRRIGARGEALSKAYLTKHDTGNALNSIFGVGERVAGGVQATFGATAEYAWNIDKGRKAGGKLPPREPTLPWILSHGIPESAEFAVRRKIARDGIPPAPFVTKAHAELKRSRFYHKEFGDAIKRTLARIRGHR